jgi:hypothetical protein
MDVGTFTFDVVSPKYGRFAVVAPQRLRAQIEGHRWYVRRDPTRVAGREFVVATNVPHPSGELIPGTPYRKWTGVLLHRFIWDLIGNPPARMIDHIDGQPLNCAENNLRAATTHQNAIHLVSKRRANKSGMTGVHFHSRDKKWVAYARPVGGKQKSLGYFDSFEDAAAARRAAVEAWQGEWAGG